ncbi:MAG: FAD:protein FMN transferase [Myxococcota bacterium]
MQWLFLGSLGCLALCWSPAPSLRAENTGPIEHGVDTIHRQEEHMSTWVTITVAGTDTPSAEGAIAAAFAEIARLEKILSEWKTDSQVAAVIANAGIGPVEVGPELMLVAGVALEVANLSQGAFDVTVGALWGLWDFRQEAPRIPSTRELAEHLPLVNYRDLVVDTRKQTLFLKRPQMNLALGGIVKGYAVDRASTILKRHGLVDHLIVAGGDIVASGRKGHQVWRIGVRHPRSASLVATLSLENQAVATSGDYQRYFEQSGKRYHHILDPKTGYPAKGASSVTVIAPSCMLADAYATAVFVKGAKHGLALAESLPRTEALIFYDDGTRTQSTSGFKELTRTGRISQPR